MEVNNTVGKWFLQFRTLHLLEIVYKITYGNYFVPYTKHFTIFFQKIKNLAN